MIKNVKLLNYYYQSWMTSTKIMNGNLIYYNIMRSTVVMNVLRIILTALLRNCYNTKSIVQYCALRY